MPRTIESIVENHQAAARLRKAGKPIWSRTIDIKSILQEDKTNTSPSHVAQVAVRIAKLLRSRVPAAVLDALAVNCDFDLLEAIEDMEQCTVDTLASDLENGVKAVDMLRGWLDVVYDWADANRVWMG